MSKILLTVCLWVTLIFLSAPQGWSGQDLEDRFINPDSETSKAIFIDVKGASLVNVLKIISKQTGLSFIASHDVEDKSITVYLNKVPLNQALETILSANGLAYEMQGDSNIFLIKPAVKTETTKITKVFQLKYATVSTSKLNSTIDAGGGGKGGSGLEEVLKDSLSTVGKVVVDARTNSLVITDVPAQFDLIESTISKLDVPVPQILIEVEMLDVSKSTEDQMGIKYGANPLAFVGGGTKSTSFPFGPNANKSSSSGSSSSSGTSSSSGSSSSSSSSSGSGSSSSSGSGASSTGFTAAGMTAMLQFMSTTSDSRTLARPRILTLNNETAKIEISADKAISIQQTQTSANGSGSTLNAVTPERYQTGVVLKVTPQANLITREITLAVSPKVIDVTASQVGNNIYDPETRGSDSILKLKDGQSMVIGGLMREQLSKSVNKIPILGDLPLIGSAFRYVDKSKDQRELIIFITPHIIDDNNQMDLKSDSASSVPASGGILNTVDHSQLVNNSLNSYESN